MECEGLLQESVTRVVANRQGSLCDEVIALGDVGKGVTIHPHPLSCLLLLRIEEQEKKKEGCIERPLDLHLWFFLKKQKNSKQQNPKENAKKKKVETLETLAALNAPSEMLPLPLQEPPSSRTPLLLTKQEEN